MNHHNYLESATLICLLIGFLIGCVWGLRCADKYENCFTQPCFYLGMILLSPLPYLIFLGSALLMGTTLDEMWASPNYSTKTP